MHGGDPQWLHADTTRRLTVSGDMLMRESGLGGFEIQSRGADGGLRMHALKPDGKTRINDVKWAELQAG